MDEEDLYYAYLEACASGAAEAPEDFFGRHPELSAETRRKIERLHEMARTRPRSTQGARRVSTDANGDVLPAERLGEFRLLERLDAGGMGTVFLAVQESLDRRVALKVIRTDLRRSKTAAARFQREARAVARLRHPNIVDVHATGEDDGLLWIAMELVPGRTLSDLLAAVRAGREELPVERCVAWIRDLGGALHYAHGEGIVHRDVKPGNVRITPEGRPLLLDFGVARDVEAQGAALTQTFAGSPLYAAPEQILGSEIDARADVYALGVTLYECLTGRVPFAGGSIEQIMRRALDEDPLPPRRLNPSMSRDLDVVCLKALEKDPGARYDTAEELARELDAVLQHRPIRARPPTAAARFRKWCRRRPGRAATVLSLVSAALLLAGIFVFQGVAAERQRKADARVAVRSARERLHLYREARSAARQQDIHVHRLGEKMTYEFLPPEKIRLLNALEDAARASKRERQAMFYAVEEDLRRAETLDPDVGGLADTRAELYFEKLLEARAAGDDATQEFYRDLVGELDVEGRFSRRLEVTWHLDITTHPPGAEILLFRYVDLGRAFPGRGHRLVPSPVDGELPVPLGSWALRVVGGAGSIPPGAHIVRVAGRPIEHTLFAGRDAGELRRLDRLVSIDGVPAEDVDEMQARRAESDSPREFVFDREGKNVHVKATSIASLGIDLASARALAEGGGVPATVHHEGEVRELTLPAGLEVRTTAAPLYPSRGCVVGTTPTRLSLEEDSYLLLFRLEGREPVRFAVTTRGVNPIVVDVHLPPKGSPAEGFVYIPDYVDLPPGFWIMEREVTCREYLEYLNDPDTLREIDEAKKPIRFPRGPQEPREGYWQRDAQGRYSLHADWAPDWPILGIDWQDARAYAAWMTRRAERKGSGLAYALPTYAQWRAAGLGQSIRYYPFGLQFRPAWTSSCYSRPQAWPEPVLRFPVDESPHGVFDMAGNAFEWLDDWYDEARGLKYAAGGSWARPTPDLFKVTGGVGYAATFANGETGMRLVLRPKAAK